MDDDLDFTAVTVVALTLAKFLPPVPATVLDAASAEAVAAVRPHLGGTERRRVTTTADDVDDDDVVMARDDAGRSSRG